MSEITGSIPKGKAEADRDRLERMWRLQEDRALAAERKSARLAEALRVLVEKETVDTGVREFARAALDVQPEEQTP